LPAETPSPETLRILDASLNRALEGLRVVEDYLRFVLEDRHLTEICKRIRHELVISLACFDMRQLHRARDTIDDVGVHVETDQEYLRDSVSSVVSASLKRVQQSLRCLEEYVKLNDIAASRTLEQLRYRTYTLEKAISVRGVALQKLGDVRLYVLVDSMQSPQQFSARVRSIVKAGVDVIQLRDKDNGQSDRELLESGHILREACCDTPTLFVMNDRPDLAYCVGADGVHLGQGDMPIKEARRIVGTSTFIGISTHNLAQAQGAVSAGADYIGVGPVFLSRTKHFDEFPGLELLREVSDNISLPIFAIGGIDRHNLADVLSTGVTRVAVSSAVMLAADPAAEVLQLRSILTEES